MKGGLTYNSQVGEINDLDRADKANEDGELDLRRGPSLS